MSQTNSPQAKVIAVRDADAMFIISGTVSTMYVTDGTVNLLKGMQGKMAATGIAAAIEGMAGAVANATMISMCEGEDVQHFGCYIGEQMVIGTFENIGFNEGDEVQMVVTKLDEKVVYAHAVVRSKDRLLWMPFSISKGRAEIAKWITKLLFGIGIAGLLFLCFLQLFIDAFANQIDLMLFMVPMLTVVGAAIGFFTYQSSKADGLYAECILKVLGFKKPKSVNLSPYSEARLGLGSSYQIYDLRKALAAYGSLNALTQ